MFILGTRVHNITLPQALQKAESFLRDSGQAYIVTPNPEITLRAKGDKKYRRILNGANLSIPDGMGLVWASRILYGRKKSIKKRIAGVDFMLNFLRYSHLNHDLPQKILLLGGRDGAARMAAQKLNKNFPQFKIYALENIYNKNISFLINDIIQPDCLLVGLGAPKQELWIKENLQKFPSVKLAVAVGGSFDFISGKTMRAPRFFRGMGLEWAWRLALQPWRAGRIFKAAVIFPALVFKEKLKK